MKNTILLIILIITIPSVVLPQSLMMQEFPKSWSGFSIKYIRPDYDSYEVSSFSGIYDMKINMPLSRKLNLVTSLPLISYNPKTEKNYFYGSSGNALGNWFLGLQTKPDYNSQSYYSVLFGVYMPIAQNQNLAQLYFAQNTNYHEYYAYMTDMLTLYANYERRFLLDDGLSWAFEVGPQIHIPTKNNSNNGQLNAHYGLSGTVEFSGFNITTEFAGLVNFSSDYSKFDWENRFLHYFNVGFGYNSYVIAPTFFYGIPLDRHDKTSISNSMFCLKLNFNLR